MIGEIGYYSLLGFILFALILRKFIQDEKNRILILLTLILSPAYSWEIITRSTIFLNITFVLAYILIVNSEFIKTNKNIIISAVLFGIILSTRSIVLVIMLPFMIFIGLQKRGIKMISLWVMVSVFAFTATFLPIIFHQGSMPTNNPFVVQNKLIPMWIPAITILLMIMLTIRINRIDIFLFYSMSSTVLIVGSYFLLIITQNGIYDALFNDRADISYIILSLPLVLIGMRENVHLLKYKTNTRSEL